LKILSGIKKDKKKLACIYLLVGLSIPYIRNDGFLVGFQSHLQQQQNNNKICSTSFCHYPLPVLPTIYLFIDLFNYLAGFHK